MAEALGVEAVQSLGKRIIVARDTRASGSDLANALISGVLSAGGSAIDAGVIPTPAVAMLTRKMQADGGVMISASHNPPEYNGIKFFDSGGMKLSAELEDRFEAALVRLAEGAGTTGHSSQQRDGQQPEAAATQAAATQAAATQATPTISALDEAAQSRLQLLDNSAELYIQQIVDTLSAEGLDLSGCRVALDCAHGAAGITSPETMRRLGAEVCAINTDYNGMDINVGCGSTNLEVLRGLVLETGADIGFSHDGDADRVLAVDAEGNYVDGDLIELICALDLKKQGKLAKDTMVVTVMSNFGLVKAAAEQGIQLIQTDVGDSKVLAAMCDGGYIIGGEPSGHTIFLDYNTTGDGLVTALCLLKAVRQSGRSLTELSQVMQRYPQVLLNVRVSDKDAVTNNPELQAAMEAAQQKLGDQGRILLRASGTEPLFRVMVEASSEATAQEIAEGLVEVVKKLDGAE
jgi:phosphoglucosamine mutase